MGNPNRRYLTLPLYYSGIPAAHAQTPSSRDMWEMMRALEARVAALELANKRAEYSRWIPIVLQALVAYAASPTGNHKDTARAFRCVRRLAYGSWPASSLALHEAHALLSLGQIFDFPTRSWPNAQLCPSNPTSSTPSNTNTRLSTSSTGSSRTSSSSLAWTAATHTTSIDRLLTRRLRCSRNGG
ncbi:hypothetical protein AAT19DRAFT_14825 [Rhodotorula toruloides]|uniref:Uncharacterized protein n=1 Tax=Rhodotorula toruloides TaxID=5286 RepID=A0A2T0A8X2_RHOTO|nr:hypothetical protein AAT19DRAFT_14825 [Rhodotorula toruloides]